MSEREFDQLLDSQLRQGPTPVGLLERLRGIAALSDVELDCRLRDVSLPAGLAKRLQQVWRTRRWMSGCGTYRCR